MSRIIISLICFLCPVSVLFSASGDNEIFHAEENGESLPTAISTLLKKIAPDIANDCGFSGKEIFLSNFSNDTHYFAISPAKTSCFGSSGTTIWVAYLKNKEATLLIKDFGFQITQLEEGDYGLHNLKITGGGSRDYKINVWSYNGLKYELTSQKSFEPEDCNNSKKSKDPDFPWVCDN